MLHFFISLSFRLSTLIIPHLKHISVKLDCVTFVYLDIEEQSMLENNCWWWITRDGDIKDELSRMEMWNVIYAIHKKVVWVYANVLWFLIHYLFFRLMWDLLFFCEDDIILKVFFFFYDPHSSRSSSWTHREKFSFPFSHSWYTNPSNPYAVCWCNVTLKG